MIKSFTKMDKEQVLCAGQGQCQFFVVRKKRLCRMGAPPGRNYCPEHEPQENTDITDSARMPCPLDPKHTCYAHNLEKHLLVCNARPTPSPDYIVKDINKCAHPVTHARVPLTEVPPSLIAQTVEKILCLYEKHVAASIEDAVSLDVSETERVILLETEGRRRRHARQAARLMALAERADLVANDTCYLDLGAGKGALAYYMWRAWCVGARGEGSVACAIELAPRRHKRDGLSGGAIVRLRADLTHLDLRAWIRGPESPFRKASDDKHVNSDDGHVKIDECCEIKNEGSLRKNNMAAIDSEGRMKKCSFANPGVVGLAKHLCGVATDYALHCMTSTLESLGSRGGLVLATCCHHRCHLADYVGLPHLQKMGMTEAELNVTLGVVSWATCGDGLSRERRAARGEGATGAKGRGEREEAGRAAKALLDWGRVLHLRTKGLDARLCRYVPATDSPENLCIVATKLAS